MGNKGQASIEITASSSRLAAGLNAARVKFQNFSSSVARGIGGAFKSINAKLEPGKMLKHAGGEMLGDLGSKGVGAFLDVAGSVRTFESELQRVKIAAGESVEWQHKLGKSLRDTSVATGINSNELSAAAGVYFDLTSDAAGMTKSLDVFGRTAQATGANVDDLVRAAAAMKDSMGVGADEFESTFSGLIQQGKAGKISLKDMGKEFPSLLAMFSKFGTGRSGVMEMGAAFQVGAKAFGSASQAATGLEAMMGMLQARQAQLKSQGVDVYKVNKDGTVTMRGLHEIVQQIADKKIDPRKWGKIFGENKEGRNFLETLIKFPKLYDDIVTASADANAVQRDGLDRANSDAGRLDIAMNRVKESIAAAFTPERITAFVNAVENLVAKLGPVVDAVGWIGDKIGGLYGVGQSVRGALTSNANGNPYAKQNTVFGAKSIDELRGTSTPEKEAERARNAAGYDRTVANIMGGEVNERTTAESIKRAVMARFDENSGVATAGNRYLANAFKNGDEVAAAVDKVLTSQGQEIGKAIREALLSVNINPTELRIGDNAVAAATANATKPRRGAR